MKKLAALAGAGALLLSMSGVALGCIGPFCPPTPPQSNDVTITNGAAVVNLVMTKADTGDNDIGGKCVGGGMIWTGRAGASSNVWNDVNSSYVGCSNCTGDTSLSNRAFVLNGVYTKADTGDNHIGGRYVHGGFIGTGEAGAASMVTNYVNYSWVDGPLAQQP